ncbi:hypothetical protein I5677_13650 [Mobilitalea sibirica]|uniref:Uncharacterized protein n=1 Tax=Mobilitalea sibirica TaxID=1462919 RepID=A0A8J7HA65_9FIRM|nr:hypothetical protein [Mobilitalea sibirica]MBH1941941.1 hypothetical protein [Mobilitalea sibirica]
MRKTWKDKVAKATGSNYKLNKKALQIKKSWDEVEGILKKSMNKNQKKK